MKLTKYFMPLAAIALLASCSDDKIVDQPDQPKLDLSKETYMDIKIVFPTTNGTRDGFLEFNDGLASEYAIDKGSVYLFKKDNIASNQTLVASGPITITGNPALDSKSDITATVSFTRFEVTDPNSLGSYYGVVILNDDNKAIDVPSNETYDDWKKKVMSKPMKYQKSDNGPYYFTMTNALGWNGTVTGTPSVDVEINNSYLYQDKNKTEHSVVTFYVQRGVSKVTISSSSTLKIGIPGDVTPKVAGAHTGDEVTLDAWGLDVTNTKTYPVQNIEISTNSTFPANFISNWAELTKPLDRFTGKGTSDFTRVYWAEDPNYAATSLEGPGTSLSYASDFDKKTEPSIKNGGDEYPAYCLENTFNVKNMNQDQSTRIVFKGTYKVGGEEGSFLSYGNKTYRLPKTGETNYVDITANVSDGSGYYKIKNLFAVNEDTEGTYAKALAAAMSALEVADETKVAYHENGVVYYTIVNRHFANNELEAQGGSFFDTWYMPNTGYPADDEAHFLGRYGMVRNNWYVISINTVSGPGEPIIPTPTPDPDDPKDPYKLDCTIHILAWAKRTHGYDI